MRIVMNVVNQVIKCYGFFETTRRSPSPSALQLVGLAAIHSSSVIDYLFSKSVPGL